MVPRINRIALETRPPAPGDMRRQAELREACIQFEALLTQQLMTSMRASIPEGGILGHSHGERLFQEMLDGVYALRMSQANPHGLAAALYRSLAPMPNASGSKYFFENISASG